MVMSIAMVFVKAMVAIDMAMSMVMFIAMIMVAMITFMAMAMVMTMDMAIAVVMLMLMTMFMVMRMAMFGIMSLAMAMSAVMSMLMALSVASESCIYNENCYILKIFIKVFLRSLCKLKGLRKSKIRKLVRFIQQVFRDTHDPCIGHSWGELQMANLFGE